MSFDGFTMVYCHLLFWRGVIVACLLLAVWHGPLCAAAGAADGSNGIIVFGPHPDDAELGCSIVMLQARERGEPVHVVILTNGDSDVPAAAAIVNKPEKALGPDDFLAISRSRQEQSQKGIAVLGLPPASLILLGYPNDGLVDMYHGRGSVPYTSPYTKKSATYAFVQEDYHAAVHGRPAPYTREAVIGDIAEILRTLKPRRVFVTDPADGHPDHSIAYSFVLDGTRKAGFRGEFYTYLIHTSGFDWPWPWGVTPDKSFEPPHPHQAGTHFPIPWPPVVRVPATAAQDHLKLLAIQCHRLRMLDPKMDREHEDYMESFVKSDEIFWVAPRKP